MSVSLDSQHFSAGGTGQSRMYQEQDSYMAPVQMSQMALAMMPAGQGMIMLLALECSAGTARSNIAVK